MLVLVAMSARRCVYTIFLSGESGEFRGSAIPNRGLSSLARHYRGLTVPYDPRGSLAAIALSSIETRLRALFVHDSLRIIDTHRYTAEQRNVEYDKRRGLLTSDCQRI